MVHRQSNDPSKTRSELRATMMDETVVNDGSDDTNTETSVAGSVSASGKDRVDPGQTVGAEHTIAGSSTSSEMTSPSRGLFEAGHKLGRYEILSLLGRGGMGSVYLAHDTQLDRKVGLKVPKFEDNGDPKLFARFYREARSAANVSHPNLCPVYDVGEIDGVHFIAMAYVQGHPLSKYIQSGVDLNQKSIAKLIRMIAVAMDEAHQCGIIHRDLKPANIMLNQRKEPIVMDFGLACQHEARDESRVTQEGTILGSPAYMSPEQLRGRQEEIGPGADIYSLGVVMYELLTGVLPFKGAGSTVALIGRILSEPPPALETIRADVDPLLAAICSRALKKDAKDRYASMKDFSDALGGYLRDRSARKLSAKAKREKSREKEPAEQNSLDSSDSEPGFKFKDVSIQPKSPDEVDLFDGPSIDKDTSMFRPSRSASGGDSSGSRSNVAGQAQRESSSDSGGRGGQSASTVRSAILDAMAQPSSEYDARPEEAPKPLWKRPIVLGSVAVMIAGATMIFASMLNHLMNGAVQDVDSSPSSKTVESAPAEQTPKITNSENTVRFDSSGDEDVTTIEPDDAFKLP